MATLAEKCQKNVKEVSNFLKSPQFICYLQHLMNTSAQILVKKLLVLLLIAGLTSCTKEPNTEFSESVKVSLRDVGHRLLLADQDATSLVKPVVALDDYRYQVSFELPLAIYPDSLVDIIKSSFKKAGLPSYYLTEVIRCEDGEVGYSYEVKQEEEKGIIPCRGRNLPKACYTLNVRFTKLPESPTSIPNYVYALALGGLLLLVLAFYKKKKRMVPITDDNFAALGRFKFYPDQNMLIKEATEISLSKKECDILQIFIAKPNQIITRDELTKRVWEDNGVITGRSLDTYISKLRKKLQDDDSIKLTNIHGVGYKLEVNL